MSLKQRDFEGLHHDDRWQLAWLPTYNKWAVMETFHRLANTLDFPLYDALGNESDHALAARLNIPSIAVSRLRIALGVQPCHLSTTEQQNLGSHHNIAAHTSKLTSTSHSPWPPETKHPPRRNCHHCQHWGTENDPDYDECRLAGHQLLQANEWFQYAGGKEGNPPHKTTTGCPQWNLHPHKLNQS